MFSLYKKHNHDIVILSVLINLIYKSIIIIFSRRPSYNVSKSPEVLILKGNIEERAIRLGEYIVNTGATVRETAAKFGISKSTVHKDIAERLKKINKALYHEARNVLDKNKAERHIRGGMATKTRWENALRGNAN